MWIWILIAVIGLAVAALTITRQPVAFRRRGFVLLGIAIAITVGIEALIRLDAISADLGSELIFLATILLAGFAVWRLPRTRDGHRG